MFRYGVTIFLSAFLLFQVQPLFGKFILPWFGGSPATWTTCVLCFQVLLLAGYVYAHLSVSRLSPRQQGTLHLVLLAGAVFFLPIVPSQGWKPTGLESPAWRILGVLAFTVGAPYLLLSSTSPLMQAWFARDWQDRSPYRLYALSNLGSLLGLLSYPFVVEPNLTLRMQAYVWSAMFLFFVVLAGWCAWRIRRQPAKDVIDDRPVMETAFEVPRLFDRALWLLLPMCGSVMLLATTNEMSQDVAAVPFLWILPLSAYLLSFTITFDSPRWYWRPVWAVLLPICTAGAYMAMKMGTNLDLTIQVSLYCAALLACCMVLHGELARIKPGSQHLTAYFLSIAGGGALGALAVSFAAPLVLNGFYEFPVGLMLSCVLFALVLYRQVHREASPSATVAHTIVLVLLLVAGIVIVRRFNADYLEAVNRYSRDVIGARVESLSWVSDENERWLWDVLDESWQVAGFATMALLLPLTMVRPTRRHAAFTTLVAAGIVAVTSGMIATSMVMAAQDAGAVESTRNFYGVLRVTQTVGGQPDTRTLQHGHITHGVQRLDNEGRHWPTTYYSENSGVGLAIGGLREARGNDGLRIGVVGLGAGTLASYGRRSDYIRFYEINAAVTRLNARHFTFLTDSPADIEVSAGDARITMERERAAGKPQAFDVLAVDAFSGDAVPLHLLTREAFGDYFYHLKPDGVLAMHVSNHYLDLGPLVRDLGEDCGKAAVMIENEADGTRTIYASTWVLVSSNASFLASDLVTSRTTPWDGRTERPKLLFTDDYANIFRILRH
jgi:spermidine synthase